ncbi:hypothetical protein [Mesorhizobium sp.]|uniref:hypothetical protein n=1 Tax=Mesorhizobium sp. TaxID=1871066 RepID=UPI00257E178C|nr:hypothetical protein [Mesorhizobium sp.]
MITDNQNKALSGATVEAVKLYNEAVKAFNIYRGDPVGLLNRAIELAPDFAMAHILKAHLFGLATEPGATNEAKAIVARVKSQRLSEREASHVAALDLLLEGQWTAAAVALDRHSVDHPHDIVALQSGHLMDFYRANARDLRDRIARALPNWSADMPGYSILLGMYSFGLEETGDYGRAEDAGRRALDLQPLVISTPAISARRNRPLSSGQLTASFCPIGVQASPSSVTKYEPATLIQGRPAADLGEESSTSPTCGVANLISFKACSDFVRGAV